MKLALSKPLNFLVLSKKFHLSAAKPCSALFVTSNRSDKTTAILQPNLDIKSRFKDTDALKKMLAVRGLGNVDVDKMKETFEFIESIKATKQTLEEKRAATTKELSKLFKSEAENEKVIKPLKAVNTMLKDNLKSMTKEIAGLEENIVIKFLRLPNEIHPYTPSESKVVFQQEKLAKLHLELAKFVAADEEQMESCKVQLELFLSQLCFSTFKSFVKTSNSDFVKSLVVEGSGLNHRDPESVFILESGEDHSEDANLHLVGGASLPAFCALFAKTQSTLDSLPVKMITVGRHYSPSTQDTPISECQSTVAEIFAVAENSSEKEYELFSQIMDDVKEFYKTLSIPFRFVSKCGSELKNWETLSTSIEIYSESRKEFVPVGFVSLCGSYISDRLLMKYKQNKSTDFLNVVTGSVVDFKKLESCLVSKEKN